MAIFKCHFCLSHITSQDPTLVGRIYKKPGYSSCTDLNITYSLDPLIDKMGLPVTRNIGEPEPSRKS